MTRSRLKRVSKPWIGIAVMAAGIVVTVAVLHAAGAEADLAQKEN